MKRYLSERPVGTRKSWKRSEPDLAVLGERLRRISFGYQPEWGDPVAAYEFRERKGPLRRVEAIFGNGRHVSISYRRDGHRVERWRCLEIGR